MIAAEGTATAATATVGTPSVDLLGDIRPLLA
jgi:hypothetical protein